MTPAEAVAERIHNPPLPTHAGEPAMMPLYLKYEVGSDQDQTSHAILEAVAMLVYADDLDGFEPLPMDRWAIARNEDGSSTILVAYKSAEPKT